MQNRTRFIISFVAFLLIFFGLMSMTGQTHVAEFYGSMGIAVIGGIITWFKLPR